MKLVAVEYGSRIEICCDIAYITNYFSIEDLNFLRINTAKNIKIELFDFPFQFIHLSRGHRKGDGEGHNDACNGQNSHILKTLK